MSPTLLPHIPHLARFPRVSGDEPQFSLPSPVSDLFSPRERG